VEEVLPPVQQAAGAQGIEVMATEVMTGGGPETRPAGRIARFVQFLRDVRNELRKVTWPTFDELKKATTVIVIFVSMLGILIGLMDSLFQLIFVKLVAKLF
jgi:preprotein translocase subunit SecE